MYTYSRLEWQNGSSSILKPSDHEAFFPNTKLDKVIRVDSVNLKTFLKKFNVNQVQLLWLDLQGAELEILSSDLSSLKHIRYIHLEVNDSPLYEGGADFFKVNQFLVSNGFRMIALRKLFNTGNALYENIELQR
jgi:hypothetical protein